MQKDALLSQLENAKNNYVLGLAAVSLFCSLETELILERNRAEFGSYVLDFSQVAALLRQEEDRNIAVHEFLKSQIRSFVKESFELLKAYCKQTGQFETFKAADWYHFSRIVRNSLSHDFKVAFRSGDEKLVPVMWGSRKIDLEMDGSDISLNFFGYVEAWELFLEFERFARAHLR